MDHFQNNFKTFSVLTCVAFLAGCSAYMPIKIENQSESPIAIGSILNNRIYPWKIPPGKSKNLALTPEPCFYLTNPDYFATFKYSHDEYTSFKTEYKLGIKWHVLFDGKELHVLSKDKEIIFELEKYTQEIEVERFCK